MAAVVGTPALPLSSSTSASLQANGASQCPPSRLSSRLPSPSFADNAHCLFYCSPARRCFRNEKKNKKPCLPRPSFIRAGGRTCTPPPALDQESLSLLQEVELLKSLIKEKENLLKAQVKMACHPPAVGTEKEGFRKEQLELAISNDTSEDSSTSDREKCESVLKETVKLSIAETSEDSSMYEMEENENVLKETVKLATAEASEGSSTLEMEKSENIMKEAVKLARAEALEDSLMSQMGAKAELMIKQVKVAKVVASEDSSSLEKKNLLEVQRKAAELLEVEGGNSLWEAKLEMEADEALNVLKQQMKAMKGQMKEKKKLMKKQKKEKKRAQMKSLKGQKVDSSSSSSSESSDGEDCDKLLVCREEGILDLAGIKSEEFFGVNLISPGGHCPSHPAPLREVTGRIEVCTSGKCKRAGSQQLLASLQESIPRLAPVIAAPSKCMGMCKSCINVRVSHDGMEAQLHSNIGVNDGSVLLKNHFGLDAPSLLPF